jgi:tetratricopeptide (TPR) repeat protein
MRFLVAGLCFSLICGWVASAAADADYFEAASHADAAAKKRRFGDAVETIEAALRKYPRDYVLTLKLAWIEFLRQRYSEAERWYREASEISDGALDARIGLGWALIQQHRCDEGVEVLKGVLAEQAHEKSAHQGLKLCKTRAYRHPHAARSGRAGRTRD